MIDSVGGLNPNQGTRSNANNKQKNTIISTGDRVSISPEAAHASEKRKIVDIVNSLEDTERNEKILKVREKLQNNEYDQLKSNQLDSVAESLYKSFFA